MRFGIFLKISQFFGGTRSSRKNKSERVKKTAKSEEFERCVICGALTDVPISMPVDLRDNYEIGLGQICAACVKQQSKTIEHENTLSTVQILQVVEQSRKETKEQLDNK